MPVKEFNCVNCGKCCRPYYIPVSGEDIWRWSTQFRTDSLEKISLEDIAFHPVIAENNMQCPFLKKSPLSKTCVCSIHGTKPDACRAFPMS